MTLFDVDKTGDDRTSAEPNSPDTMAARMAHQTTSSHYQTPGQDVAARLQQVGKTFIANDGITNKAIFGYNPALQQWGFFVAKDGVDVTTNTDLNQFVFNSGQNTFKIVSSPTFPFPDITGIANKVGPQYGTETIWSYEYSHNLGYVPTYQLWLGVGNRSQIIDGADATYGSWPKAFTTGAGAFLGTDFYTWRTYATNTVIGVKILRSYAVVSGQTLIAFPGFISDTFKLYLTQETAN